MTLKTRLLLISSGLSVLFAAFMIFDRVLVARSEMLDRAGNRVEYIVSFVTEVSAAPLKTGRTQDLEKVLKGFGHFENIAYLKVSDLNGRLLYRQARSGISIADRKPDPDIFNSGDGIFDVAHDIIKDDQRLGVVQLGMSTEGIRESVYSLMWRGILLAVAFLVLITAAVWLAALKLGGELESLAGLGAALGSETLPQLPGPDPRTETGRIVTAMRDTHARLKAEEARRTEAETQRADFFAMTVHDLKQPLTSLKAALDMLLPEEERKNYTAVQIRGLAAIAGTSLKMLNTMVVDVLNMARMTSRDFVPEKTRIPLAALMRECADENSVSVAAAGKKWSVALPGGLGDAWLFGDRDLIKRVIGNLVLNAIQYTPEGGAVTLGLRFVSRDRAAIYVSDEGEGIPDNFREEIFQKYRGMGKSSKNIGLGLAFCKLVADRHSAVLDIKSETGKGTEISLVLPVSIGGREAGHD